MDGHEGLLCVESHRVWCSVEMRRREASWELGDISTVEFMTFKMFTHMRSWGVREKA